MSHGCTGLNTWPPSLSEKWQAKHLDATKKGECETFSLLFLLQWTRTKRSVQRNHMTSHCSGVTLLEAFYLHVLVKLIMLRLACL